MRRHGRSRGAVAALALSLFVGCTQLPPPQPDEYAAVNRALRGERAIVELAGGEVATGVRHVRLAPAATTWSEGSRTMAVPTSEVERVIVVRDQRERGAAGAVLLFGLGLSLVFDDVRPFAVALDVALDEFVWGMPVGPEIGRVVYIADGAP